MYAKCAPKSSGGAMLNPISPQWHHIVLNIMILHDNNSQAAFMTPPYSHEAIHFLTKQLSERCRFCRRNRVPT